jgi:hypothetical protein
MMTMNTNKTEIIFVLDRSGSMGGLESDTIGGFNAFIDAQKKLEGETIVTAVLFDDRYEILWNGIDASKAKLTEEQYFVRGSTALLDAVGKTILDVGYRLSQTVETEKPGKVIVVITTDGMENASKEFTQRKVSELIRHQQVKHDWDFIFLGANIDAVKEAGNIGIDPSSAMQYKATSAGVHDMYCMASNMVTDKRRK